MIDEKNVLNEEQLKDVAGGAGAEEKGACKNCGKDFPASRLIRSATGDNYCKECSAKLLIF